MTTLPGEGNNARPELPEELEAAIRAFAASWLSPLIRNDDSKPYDESTPEVDNTLLSLRGLVDPIKEYDSEDSYGRYPHLHDFPLHESSVAIDFGPSVEIRLSERVVDELFKVVPEGERWHHSEKNSQEPEIDSGEAK